MTVVQIKTVQSQTICVCQIMITEVYRNTVCYMYVMSDPYNTISMICVTCMYAIVILVSKGRIFCFAQWQVIPFNIEATMLSLTRLVI